MDNFKKYQLFLKKVKKNQLFLKKNVKKNE